MAPGLSAIILAAGLSTRMGAFKPLLPLGNTTVLGQCIDLLRQAGVQRIVTVSGHRAGELAVEARAHAAQPVYNPLFKTGMYSSIQAGVQALAAASGPVFLLPVDMPLIRSGTPALLAQAMDKTATGAAALQVAHPVFRGERGHPLCIRAGLLRQLCLQSGQPGGLRPLLALHEEACPQEVGEVAVADANILFDLDTPEAYTQGCALFSRRDYPTLEEAELIVRHIHPMPVKGLAHGQLVGKLAARFATAINKQSNSNLVPELCRVGGLLHDVAKGQPRHESEGAAWLRRLGFPQAAAIVAAHKDLDWQEGDPLSERELVHLADKLVRGQYLLSIDARFTEKLVLYAEDPEAQAAIKKRHALARRLAQAVEEASGCELDAFCASLAGATAPPAPSFL